MALLFVSIAAFQNKLTATMPLSWKRERMTYLPKSEVLKPLLCGFQSTYANYLWIKTMIYFGGHALSDKKFTWFAAMIDMVTRLNPYFYPPFEYAGILVADYSKNPDVARVILQRGLGLSGTGSWKIPFYLGWIYFKYYNDKYQSAQYLSLAARAGAPPHVSVLAAKYFSEMGYRERALAFLYSLYETTENPKVKSEVKKKIEALQQ